MQQALSLIIAMLAQSMNEHAAEQLESPSDGVTEHVDDEVRRLRMEIDKLRRAQEAVSGSEDASGTHGAWLHMRDVLLVLVLTLVVVYATSATASIQKQALFALAAAIHIVLLGTGRVGSIAVDVFAAVFATRDAMFNLPRRDPAWAEPWLHALFVALALTSVASIGGRVLSGTPRLVSESLDAGCLLYVAVSARVLLRGQHNLVPSEREPFYEALAMELFIGCSTLYRMIAAWRIELVVTLMLAALVASSHVARLPSWWINRRLAQATAAGLHAAGAELQHQLSALKHLETEASQLSWEANPQKLDEARACIDKLAVRAQLAALSSVPVPETDQPAIEAELGKARQLGLDSATEFRAAFKLCDQFAEYAVVRDKLLEQCRQSPSEARAGALEAARAAVADTAYQFGFTVPTALFSEAEMISTTRTAFSALLSEQAACCRSRLHEVDESGRERPVSGARLKAILTQLVDAEASEAHVRSGHQRLRQIESFASAWERVHCRLTRPSESVVFFQEDVARLHTCVRDAQEEADDWEQDNEDIESWTLLRDRAHGHIAHLKECHTAYKKIITVMARAQPPCDVDEQKLAAAMDEARGIWVYDDDELMLEAGRRLQHCRSAGPARDELLRLIRCGEQVPVPEVSEYITKLHAVLKACRSAGHVSPAHVALAELRIEISRVHVSKEDGKLSIEANAHRHRVETHKTNLAAVMDCTDELGKLARQVASKADDLLRTMTEHIDHLRAVVERTRDQVKFAAVRRFELEAAVQHVERSVQDLSGSTRRLCTDARELLKEVKRRDEAAAELKQVLSSHDARLSRHDLSCLEPLRKAHAKAVNARVDPVLLGEVENARTAIELELKTQVEHEKKTAADAQAATADAQVAMANAQAVAAAAEGAARDAQTKAMAAEQRAVAAEQSACEQEAAKAEAQRALHDAEAEVERARQEEATAVHLATEAQKRARKVEAAARERSRSVEAEARGRAQAAENHAQQEVSRAADAVRQAEGTRTAARQQAERAERERAAAEVRAATERQQAQTQAQAAQLAERAREAAEARAAAERQQTQAAQAQATQAKAQAAAVQAHAQAQAQVQAQRLAQAQAAQTAHTLPHHWEKVTAARVKDGFAVLKVDSIRDASVWRAFERLLVTDPVKLRQSGADRHGTRHDRLQLKCAWRLEHPPMWEKYTSAQQGVLRDKKLLSKAHAQTAGGLPVATAAAASTLPGPLKAEVNEAWLLHGTGPDKLLSVLSTGPNERFSGTNAGTAYGDGTYLAEDPGKNDQYVTVDEQWDQGSELHKRLYGHNHRHPGKVYYLLVCRVVLGHHVRTQQSGRNSVSTDGGSRIFPISFRELAPVPGVTPPVHYHSLLADVVSVGARYREVVVFHSELIYPEYVLAYQRFEGARGPL